MPLPSVNTSNANGRSEILVLLYRLVFYTRQLIVAYPTDAAQSKAINSEMYEHT